MRKGLRILTALWVLLLLPPAYGAEAPDAPQQIPLNQATYEDLLISKGRLFNQIDRVNEEGKRLIDAFTANIQAHDAEIAKRFPDKVAAAKAEAAKKAKQ